MKLRSGFFSRPVLAAAAQMCRDAALTSITADEERRDAFRMAREMRERHGRASVRISCSNIPCWSSRDEA
jgi:hypothetical protein